MKRKLVWMLWVAAVLGLVLTGCGQQRTQASYIGADAAKAIALDAAGIAEGGADTPTNCCKPLFLRVCWIRATRILLLSRSTTGRNMQAL